jgi:putative zinc finger/helix-turn-helix YgiT family protein
MATARAPSKKTDPCALCGATAVEIVQRVEIQPLGKRHTFEPREWSCATCGEAYTDDEQGRANAGAERSAKAEALRSITGDDVRAFREHLGARQGELEQLLGLSPGALSRWESGGREVPAYVVATFRLIALRPSLLRELADVMGVEFTEKEPSKAGRPRVAAPELTTHRGPAEQGRAKRVGGVASPAARSTTPKRATG